MDVHLRLIWTLIINARIAINLLEVCLIVGDVERLLWFLSAVSVRKAFL